MSPQSREHEPDTYTPDVFFDCFLPPDAFIFFEVFGGRAASHHNAGLHASYFSLSGVEGGRESPAAYLRTSQYEIRSKSARRGRGRVARRLDAPAILRSAGDPQGNITHLGATLRPTPGVPLGTVLPAEHTGDAVLPITSNPPPPLSPPPPSSPVAVFVNQDK